MKVLCGVLAVLLTAPSMADTSEQYLCTADLTVGFFYNTVSKKWDMGNFKADAKYVVSRRGAQEAESAFLVWDIGDDELYRASCRSEFNKYGFLFCNMGDGGEFKFNRINGRYLATYTSGYFNVVPGNKLTDASSSTPIIEIGRCSRL